MKRVMFLFFAVVICLCLSVGCFAQDDVGQEQIPTLQEDGEREGEFDVKTYIMEKIVPVAVVAKIKTTECCFYQVKPHRSFSFEKQGVCGAECIEGIANDYATVEVLIST